MEFSIAQDSNIPLHTQLLNQLRHAILSGQWAPSSRLPSETEFQRDLDISRSTIRQALSRAELEGLIERVPGKGTFVASNPAPDSANRFIGYVTVDLLSSDLQFQLLNGAESAARANGYRILFSNSRHKNNEENKLLDQLIRDQVGGILIWPILHDGPSDRLFQVVNQNTVPLVLMDRFWPGAACDSVVCDSYAGTYSAVKYLFDLGHKDIAFLTPPIFHLFPIAERLRGYQDAMRETGLTSLEPWLIESEFPELRFRHSMQAYSTGTGSEIEQIIQLLEQPQRPTAICASNDLMAMLAMKAANAVGIQIPEDLSVVGFDDMEMVAHLEVPLTTVRYDGFTAGKLATELLIERIEGFEGRPRKRVSPTSLKVRASTAPPATSH